MSKKRSTEQKKQKETVNLDLIFEPGKRDKGIIISAITVVSFILAYYYLRNALSINGYFAFPLDDPWIHLTFARNLVQYHSFSYFKNEMATAGSTSPIYTFILAAGFVFYNNEMILSYALGILFFIFSGIAFYKLTSFEFGKENYYAVLFTAIFVVDKWMNFISVTGMETTMYIFMLISTAYFYKKKQAVPFAVFLGLILWGRPDSVAFMAALAADYFLAYKFSKSGGDIKLFTKKDFIKIGIIAGSIAVIYLGFNLMLSGSLLPNTYSAKLAYYSPEFRSRISFLKYEVWDYFTRGAYGVIIIGFFVSAAKMIFDLFKKKYNGNLLYILFPLLLVFIYWYKLPYAHRFGRYLMPAIPFIILLSGLGFRDLCKLAGNYMQSGKIAQVLMIGISSVIILYSFFDYKDNAQNYAEQCVYIHDRHVVTANWIKDNTKPDDVIATHDVGAIGFYCNRKIVDAAGLMNPELISKINDDNYASIMSDFMKKNNVNYLAFQREWFRVVNQNPLYTSINKEPIEGLDVYKFEPDKTHIISRETNSLIMTAQDMMAQRAYQQAIQYLIQAVKTDPQSSYTYLILAFAYGAIKDSRNYEINLSKALEIFPEYKDALFQYANYCRQTGRNDESKKYLERIIKTDPENKRALDMLKAFSDTTKTK
jgi:tetratricopeptide (TPR) repeat protein